MTLHDDMKQWLEAMEHAERHCPCGARPENLPSWPHVIGCQVAAAIASLRARIEDGGWMPIATAPRDGTHLWLGDSLNMRLGFWSDALGWVDLCKAESCDPVRGLGFTPTHWQPLPPAPKEKDHE